MKGKVTEVPLETCRLVFNLSIKNYETCALTNAEYNSWCVNYLREDITKARNIHTGEYSGRWENSQDPRWRYSQITPAVPNAIPMFIIEFPLRYVKRLREESKGHIEEMWWHRFMGITIDSFQKCHTKQHRVSKRENPHKPPEKALPENTSGVHRMDYKRFKKSYHGKHKTQKRFVSPVEVDSEGNVVNKHPAFTGTKVSERDAKIYAECKFDENNKITLGWYRKRNQDLREQVEAQQVTISKLKEKIAELKSTAPQRFSEDIEKLIADLNSEPSPGPNPERIPSQQEGTCSLCKDQGFYYGISCSRCMWPGSPPETNEQAKTRLKSENEKLRAFINETRRRDIGGLRRVLIGIREMSNRMS